MADEPGPRQFPRDLPARLGSLSDPALADVFVFARERYVAALVVRNTSRASFWRDVVLAALEQAGARASFVPDDSPAAAGLLRIDRSTDAVRALCRAVEHVHREPAAP